MLKVICFGEALVDMLSTGSDGGAPEQFRKFPGGAPANAAVAVARLGGAAWFAGMLGEDMFGRFLHDALRDYGVRTDYVRFTGEARTGLAFVSLDAVGERSFEFYRPPAADLLFRSEHLPDTAFTREGILHICSNSLTEQGIAQVTEQLVQRARDNGWLVSFDVNLRHNLWPAGTADRAIVLRLLRQADLVKMSREELDYLAEGDPEFVSTLLRQGAALVLVTDGARPLHWYSHCDRGELLPPQVDTVDTTAAGDAFVGGLIYQLAQQRVGAPAIRAWLESDALMRVLRFACACGAHAASMEGAFSSLPNQRSIRAFGSALSCEFDFPNEERLP
ncbi:carbohydrate kinase family protein [Biformimicrobium ophioploci]|uniref:Carbohydrate kinase n=1 Tax=Biformimicrobium ophioploci TaxID=3036711 RepID=A0ABQ6LWM4_9GAMM|nr:carbohydrate kinase [Microbulbifer sp. NKW57]GMG86473.1 carbohydrate kinase [Microbulbifer sp. NKW57]